MLMLAIVIADVHLHCFTLIVTYLLLYCYLLQWPFSLRQSATLNDINFHGTKSVVNTLVNIIFIWIWTTDKFRVNSKFVVG